MLHKKIDNTIGIRYIPITKCKTDTDARFQYPNFCHFLYQILIPMPKNVTSASKINKQFLLRVPNLEIIKCRTLLYMAKTTKFNNQRIKLFWHFDWFYFLFCLTSSLGFFYLLFNILFLEYCSLALISRSLFASEDWI